MEKKIYIYVYTYTYIKPNATFAITLWLFLNNDEHWFIVELRYYGALISSAERTIDPKEVKHVEPIKSLN